jgi:hypothetical protein
MNETLLYQLTTHGAVAIARIDHRRYLQNDTNEERTLSLVSTSPEESELAKKITFASITRALCVTCRHNIIMDHGDVSNPMCIMSVYRRLICGKSVLTHPPIEAHCEPADHP